MALHDADLVPGLNDDIIIGLRDLASSTFIESTVKPFVTGMLASINQLFHWVATSFLRDSTPGVPDGNDPLAQGGKFGYAAWWTTDHLIWLSVIMCTLALAITGGKLLWNYTHGVHDSLKNVLRGMITMLVCNLLGLQMVRVLLWAGDQFTTWILAEADFKGDANCLALTAESARQSGGLMLLLFLCPIFLISMLLQYVLLILRGGVLVLLAGTIILPASMATTETGRKWLNKMLSWMIAFICMKPAMATIYAIAFKLFDPAAGRPTASAPAVEISGQHVGSGSFGSALVLLDVKVQAAAPADQCAMVTPSGPSEVFAPLILLAAAGLVMPALLKLITPIGSFAGSTLAGAGGGGGGGQGEGSPAGSSTPAQSGTGGAETSGAAGGGGLSSGPTGAATAETASTGAASAGSGAATGGGTAAAGSAAGTAAAGAATAATGGAALGLLAAKSGADVLKYQVGYEIEREFGGEPGDGPLGSGSNGGGEGQ